MSEERKKKATELFNEPVTLTISRGEFLVLSELVKEGIHSMHRNMNQDGKPPFTEKAIPLEVQNVMAVRGVELALVITKRADRYANEVTGEINKSDGPR